MNSKAKPHRRQPLHQALALAIPLLTANWAQAEETPTTVNESPQAIPVPSDSTVFELGEMVVNAQRPDRAIGQP
jgi:hypothetical protein